MDESRNAGDADGRLLLLAVAEVVPDDDVRFRDGRQSCAGRRTGECRRKREIRCGRLPLRMLAPEPDVDPARVPEATGAPIDVIAGATVTDSTVSLISRRQAARRFAGSRSLSISSGPMTSLSPPSPSRARATCASSSAVVSFSKVSWLTRRPNNPSPPSCRIASSRTAFARSIASSASRICRLRDARGGASAVAEYARTASSTISSTRSALTAARRRQRSALVSPQR